MTNERSRIVRDICHAEGHGSLVDVTSYGDMPHRRYLCQRGCGVDIWELGPRTPLAEIVSVFGDTNGAVVHGRLEIWPGE